LQPAAAASLTSGTVEALDNARQSVSLIWSMTSMG